MFQNLERNFLDAKIVSQEDTVTMTQEDIVVITLDYILVNITIDLLAFTDFYSFHGDQVQNL